MWRTLWRFRLVVGCVLSAWVLFDRLVANTGGAWR